MNIIPIVGICACSSEYARRILQSTRAKYPKHFYCTHTTIGWQLIWSLGYRIIIKLVACDTYHYMGRKQHMVWLWTLQHERTWIHWRACLHWLCVPNASTFANFVRCRHRPRCVHVCVFVTALRTHTFHSTCVHSPLSCALTFVGTSSKKVKRKVKRFYLLIINVLRSVGRPIDRVSIYSK